MNYCEEVKLRNSESNHWTFLSTRRNSKKKLHSVKCAIRTYSSATVHEQCNLVHHIHEKGEKSSHLCDVLVVVNKSGSSRIAWKKQKAEKIIESREWNNTVTLYRMISPLSNVIIKAKLKSEVQRHRIIIVSNHQCRICLDCSVKEIVRGNRREKCAVPENGF